MAERNSFVFYRSFYEAIKDLPRDVQGEVYTAIMEYSLNGITTEQLKPIARSIFTLIKPNLDATNARYDNGKKGGRPTKEKPNHNLDRTKTEPNTNLTKTKPKPRPNLDLTKTEPNKDKDKDKDKDKEEGENSPPPYISVMTKQPIKVLANKIYQDQTMNMQTQLLGINPSPEIMKKIFNDFLSHLTGRNELEKAEHDFRTHFLNWLRKTNHSRYKGETVVKTQSTPEELEARYARN